MAEHKCVRCIANPPKSGNVRKIVSGKTARTWLCATHDREKKKEDKLKRRYAHVARQFGITADEYVALYEYQGGTCALPRCRATGASRALAVEHDHDLAKLHDHPDDKACRHCVRGLVCYVHNYWLLGRLVGDLQDGLDYLDDPPFQRMRREGLV